MGTPGRPRGSYSKEKLFRSALRKVLLEKKAEKLRKVADALIQRAIAKDLQAIDRIADRLEGKLIGGAATANDSPESIHRIENVIVHPKRPEGEEEVVNTDGPGAGCL